MSKTVELYKKIELAGIKETNPHSVKLGPGNALLVLIKRAIDATQIAYSNAQRNKSDAAGELNKALESLEEAAYYASNEANR